MRCQCTARINSVVSSFHRSTAYFDFSRNICPFVSNVAVESVLQSYLMSRYLVAERCCSRRVFTNLYNQSHGTFCRKSRRLHFTCDDMSRKPPLTTETSIHTVFHMNLSTAGCGKGWASCRKICNIVSRSSNGVLESYLDMYPVEWRYLWDIRRRT